MRRIYGHVSVNCLLSDAKVVFEHKEKGDWEVLVLLGFSLEQGPYEVGRGSPVAFLQSPFSQGWLINT